MAAHRPAVVRTERLVVRDWRDDEADRMFDMYSRPEVVQWLGSSEPMASLDQARRSIARARKHNAEAAPACGWWAVEVASTGTVVGTIALVPLEGDPDGALEIAWHMHPDSQHLGYATEAARAILDRAHALEVPEVLALIAPANSASRAVARRLDIEPRGLTERYYGMPLEMYVSRGRSIIAAPSPDTTRAGHDGFAIRPGSLDDAPLVLRLFDDAIRWMIERDLTDQWGRQPFSTDPSRSAAVTRWATDCELLVAEHRGLPVAAIMLGDAPAYAPPADGPELYVVALVAARTACARGAGRALLGAAERVAAERGVPTLRLDCFAGNDGALVRYYQGVGFSPTERFSVGEWPGQVLQRTVSRPPAG